MMKCFCDVCGSEIKRKQAFLNGDFFVVSSEYSITVEVKAPVDTHICKYCLINSFNKFSKFI